MLIKRIVGILIFLLVANAGIRLALVFFHDQQFKDSVREAAILMGQPPAKSDEVVKNRVMELAQQNQIPLYPDYVDITRQSGQGLGEKIVVHVTYAVNVALFPGYSRRFDFEYTTP